MNYLMVKCSIEIIVYCFYGNLENSLDCWDYYLINLKKKLTLMFIHNKTERFGTAKRTFFTTTGWRAFSKVLRFQQPQLLLMQPIFDQEDFWHPDVRLRVLTWLLLCCFTPPFPRPISIAFLRTINRTNNHFSSLFEVNNHCPF